MFRPVFREGGRARPPGAGSFKMAGALPDAEQEFELSILKAIPGVLGVYVYPKSGYDATDFNKNRVVVKFVVEPEARIRTITTPCTAEMPLVVDAVIAAKEKVANLVGSAAIAAAEQQVKTRAGSTQPAAPAALTEADML